MTCTFLIPVKHDSPDRDQNLRLAHAYLTKHFPECPTHIGEQGGNHYSHYANYTHFDYQAFHRTKMLNEMARAAVTSVIVNYDADVLLPTHQLRAAIQVCANGSADFAYPYGGDFVLVPRMANYGELLRGLDVGFLARKILQIRQTSVGGCVVCNTASYWKYGGENERMISYAPEDVERWERWHKLGALVVRIAGPLYHIEHKRGQDSWVKHPYYRDNVRELERCRAMSEDELWHEIRNWSWARRWV